MVAQDFFDLLKKLHPKKGAGIEDFSDRFNYQFTVLMLILCSSIVTVKQYVFKPISCYVSTPHGGHNLVNYMENYCWIHGSNPLNVHGQLPNTFNDWKKIEMQKVYYYQWIPFVLGLQAILFYLPRMIWQIVTTNASGTNIAHLMTTATQASTKQQVDRDKLVSHVAKCLEQVLIHNREYRQGSLAKLRRSLHRLFCGFVISKRLGTWLVLWYIFIKILYVFNGCAQIYMMQAFLGLDSTYDFFGYDILKDIISGRTWQQTKIFPRVTFCHVPLRTLGHTAGVVGQCVLPVNMLNEKIYIFLWFWIVICASFTGISVPVWVFRISLEKYSLRFVLKYLKLSDIYCPKEKPVVRKFVTNFLRHDGVFLLRMLSLNAGDLTTSDIVIQLWSTFRDRFKNRDFRDDGIDQVHKNTIHLDRVQNGSGVCHPTAPANTAVAPSYEECKKFLQMDV